MSKQVAGNSSLTVTEIGIGHPVIPVGRAVAGWAAPIEKPYLISQERLDEVLSEADTLKWDTVEWRDGKWVWVHG